MTNLFSITPTDIDHFLSQTQIAQIHIMAKRITSGEQFIRLFDGSLCPADRELLQDENLAHFAIRDIQGSFRTSIKVSRFNFSTGHLIQDEDQVDRIGH